MTDLFFHFDELYVIKEKEKAILIRLNDFSEKNLITFYKHMWIPRSQIRRFKKQQLPNGETMFILDIPDWLIEEKGLQEFYYEDPLKFMDKVNKLKKGYKG